MELKDRKQIDSFLTDWEWRRGALVEELGVQLPCRGGFLFSNWTLTDILLVF